MEKHILEGYCRNQLGAIHDYKIEWQADRYQVGGKMFAMLGGDSVGKPILSLKCDPERAEY
ncbi:MmcQ/YjbR family DNA-binding protein, partial [Bacillus pseudomycoides]